MEDNFTQIKKIISIFLVLISVQGTFAQTKFDNINFKVLNMAKSPAIETLIRLERNDIEVKLNLLVSEIATDSLSNKVLTDTSFVIKSNNFDKLVNAILAIPSTALYPTINFKGLNGSKTELEFGNESNSIVYRVWSPDKETKKRELDAYMNLCKQITKLAKLNIKEML